MSEEPFDRQVLTEKLSRLNNSQQSIESLSRWCISYRKRAREIVETWGCLFGSSQPEQSISFLYLANDILQNSKRKGNEFVSEFWRVIPASLKLVYENAEEREKSAIIRLVDIWEERKVFGSRGIGLKDEVIGKTPPTRLSFARSSNPVKIVRRDQQSLRIKLAVGGVPEKIMTAFHSVFSANDEVASDKCEAAVSQMDQIAEDIEATSVAPPGNLLDNEIQEQEDVLQQCVECLENAQANRLILASQLKKALQDQESRLEHITTQLQAARTHIEQAINLRKRLAALPPPRIDLLPQSPPLPPPPMIPFPPHLASSEESNKAAAAALAAKLAASSSSAQMLTSVLSSLVAEEAAASMMSPEKKQRFDMSVPETSNHPGSTTSLPGHSPVTAISVMSCPNLQSPTTQIPSSIGMVPPYPPPPPPSSTQISSYSHESSHLPPPPPLPQHIAAALTGPQPPAQQQKSAGVGFYMLPGGFFGQNHQPATPPMPRQ